VQSTLFFSVIKINLLTLFTKIIPVCVAKNSKKTNELCGQNGELLKVRPVGT
jgi:hypothetical protein